MRIRTLSGLCVLFALPVARAGAQQLSATERAQAVAILWGEARYNFAYWDRVRADWDSALAANLRLAQEPQSDLRFLRRLRRFLALLADGQATVIAPPALRSRIARPPLLVRAVERRPVLLDYAENDEMRVARPERLAEILAVQGVPAETWIRDSVLPEISAATTADRWQRAVAGMLEGERGSAVHLLLRLPGGEERGISVTRSVSDNDRWPFERPALELDSLPGSVVVARVNSLADPDVVRQFDRSFPDFAGLTGMILDLRDDGGGRSEYGYQILARLTDRPFATVRWKTPEHRAVFRAWRMPDSATTWYGMPPDTIAPSRGRPVYTGPLALLASARTAGAAEDLLAAVRSASRGAIVGEPSAGCPGEALVIPLPKNWGFQLSVKREAFPDGMEFAGIGVVPEIPVQERLSDVQAGRDAVLERARQYLSQRTGQPPN